MRGNEDTLLAFAHAIQRTERCHMEEFDTGKWNVHESRQQREEDEEIVHDDDDDDGNDVDDSEEQYSDENDEDDDNDDDDDDDDDEADDYEEAESLERKSGESENEEDARFLSPEDIEAETRLSLISELRKAVKGSNIWINKLFTRVPGAILWIVKSRPDMEKSRNLQDRTSEDNMSLTQDGKDCEVPLSMCWPFMLERVIKIGKRMVEDTSGISKTLTPTLSCTLFCSRFFELTPSGIATVLKVANDVIRVQLLR